MYLIDLDRIPNQTFNIMLENTNYRVALRSIKGLTYMSVWANGEILFYNQICVPNGYVNPFNYLSQNGKFYFQSDNGDYPYYTEYGKTVRLYFYTKDEVKNA